MNRKERRAKEKVGQPVRADAPDPAALHSLGIEAFRTGQLEKAADLIAQAIGANGQRPEFHYNLAIVFKAQGKLQAAAASYQRAITLKPDYPDAHNNLGNVWMTLGQPDQARASFERALQYRPGNADTHYNLGILCSDAGDPDQAARHFHHCLDHDPDDSRGAGILLAHLGLAPAPERTSPAQLQKIYDVRSQFWDRENSYFGHALVAEALKTHAGRAGLDVLDIGCGTGLAGALVRPFAGRLDGVDLSPAMLHKAQDKGLYDGLYEADLISFMSARTGSYDAVTAAASLIHFGDLQAVFQAASLCLRAKGLFVFTLFAHEAADFAVAPNGKLARSGCYAHGAGYVRRLAGENGFSVEMLKQAVHEHDQDGNPVAGLVAVLQRA